jgi:hypothetical protein
MPDVLLLLLLLLLLWSHDQQVRVEGHRCWVTPFHECSVADAVLSMILLLKCSMMLLWTAAIWKHVCLCLPAKAHMQSPAHAVAHTCTAPQQTLSRICLEGLHNTSCWESQQRLPLTLQWAGQCRVRCLRRPPSAHPPPGLCGHPHHEQQCLRVEGEWWME